MLSGNGKKKWDVKAESGNEKWEAGAEILNGTCQRV
jgi:hypothetical protein